MNILSVASHFPEKSYTQIQCYDAMRQADFWSDLNPNSKYLLEKVLLGDSGIDKRHFSLNSIQDAWSFNAQEQNHYFEFAAPALAAGAFEKVLDEAGFHPRDVDAIFICSCTGFLCPGISSYVAERLGMRGDVFMQDITGLGCGAAIPLMRLASNYIAENPSAVVATIAVEVCSAAFFAEDDPGVLISNCIFGDGAAAALWSGSKEGWQVEEFDSIHIPQEREKIRFTNSGGRLRNQLAADVPSIAAKAVEKLYARRVGPSPDAWVTHGGGKTVIEELEEALSVEELRHARRVMEKYGNVSSASVLVALEHYLRKERDDELVWMCTFGAGFSAHSCELTR